MTLEEMRNSEKVFLTPADVAPLLECDPNSLRAQAQEDPSKLGFRTIVIGSRVKFPRLPFLRFIGEVYGDA